MTGPKPAPVLGALPRGEAPLGIITKSTSPPQGGFYSNDEKKAFSDAQKVKRYSILAVARSILSEKTVNSKGFIVPTWRIVNCRRKLNFRKTEYEIHTSYNSNGEFKSWLGGVCVCGSVHVCAVDAFTVGQKRGQELTAAIEKKGLSQAFLVVTARHNRGSDCGELYKLLQAGLSFAMSGAPYQRFKNKWGIVGTVTGWDYTCSISNGHHPHKNILFLSPVNLDNVSFEADLQDIAARYERYLEKQGVYTNSHTSKVLTNKQDCARYLTKWALSLEVSQVGRKEAKQGHFTQFELLNEIGYGDISEETRQAYIKLFREFAIASKGKRQLVYSKGLRDLLGLGEDKTDEELSQEGEDPSWILTTLTPEQFKPIMAREKGGALARVLLAARDAGGDPGAFWDYLEANFGIVGTDAQRNPMPAVLFENDEEEVNPEKQITDEQLELAAIAFDKFISPEITGPVRARIAESLQRAEVRQGAAFHTCEEFVIE